MCLTSMRRIYRKYLNSYAATHRTNSTKAEIRLWCEILRKRQLKGIRFRRLVQFGNFIAVFFCQEMHLVIVVVGYTNDAYLETIENDRKKDAFFEKIGLTVLRFSDDQVLNGIDSIREELETYVENSRNRK